MQVVDASKPRFGPKRLRDTEPGVKSFMIATSAPKVTSRAKPVNDSDRFDLWTGVRFPPSPPIFMKVCEECNSEFKATSKHRRCYRCRYQSSRDTCDCGASKHRKSVRCKACELADPSPRRAVLRGPNHPGWKGGRAIKHGYVRLYAPDHPRASAGYVFEHVLVMESMLGRHLLNGENVHHKNGVRDDNRPENLELWVKPQPSGIRAVDALEWARKIIETYDGLEPILIRKEQTCSRFPNY